MPYRTPSRPPVARSGALRATHAETAALLARWPEVVAFAEPGWPRDFALSVQRQAQRPGWRPTTKQASCMRRMVRERGEPDGPVIEDDAGALLSIIQETPSILRAGNAPRHSPETNRRTAPDVRVILGSSEARDG